MARYRKVDSRIWNDAKFAALSDRGKLAFFFLLTHPHMTALGAMRTTPAGLAAELGWLPEAFGEAFREALSKGLVRCDERACFVWLPNFLKYNAPESPNVVRAWASAWDLIPECGLKGELLQRVKAFAEALPEGFAKAFREAFAKSMPNPEPEPEPYLKNPPTPQGGEGVSVETQPQKKQTRVRTTADPEADPNFARFWAAYPRKVKKPAAAKAFAKHTPDDALVGRMLAAIEKHRRSEKWTKDGGEYIPYPASWLNDRRWEDELPAPPPPAAAPPPRSAADVAAAGLI